MNPLLGQTDSEVQVWPSYTDVALNLILVLVLYLFTLIVYASKTVPCQQEIRRNQTNMRQAVEQAIQPELRKQVLKITEDGNLQRFTFADRILFDSGQAQLKTTGMEILGAIGGAFKKQVGAFKQIQIEGHTDDRPTRIASNWELSSARATSVVRFLQDQSELNPDLLSATGHSQYQPVDSNEGEEGRARNRRIEIVLVYSAKNCGPSTAKPNKDTKLVAAK